ncbi:MAG: serine/threonine-protein kinase [Myxococcota bacterium]
MSDESPRAGVVIGGRYQLGKLIGEGRTGRVYRAHDTKSTERVAVKLLHKPLCSVPEPVRRFAREFEATRRIDHPNVVRSIAFGQQADGPLEGTHFLVMELLDGRRLVDVLASGPLDAARTVRIALDVAQALAAAHQEGIVHRDVEPSNVVLQRVRGKDVAKVLDFGLARLASNDEALTDFGIRLGTAEYMSPEYVETGELEPRSDVYALGVMMYAMLTGAPPFVGRMLIVMQEQVTATPPPLSIRVPGVATWLEVLVMEMLAKQPEHRPSAVEVVERLRENLAATDLEVGVERRALASFEGSAMPPPAAVAHHSEQAPVYPDPKPLPKVPLLITVALLGFGLIGLVGLTSIVGVLLMI